MTSLPVSDRTRVTRARDRQSFDRADLDAVLDEALIAHVAVTRPDGPLVLPMLFARDGDSLLLHGSTGGGLFRAAARGVPVAVGVTLVDGLVFARSLFDSSMNYRSAVVLGIAEEVTDREEKLRALEVLSERLLPERPAELRATTGREAAATMVLRVPLAEASVKIRAAGPSDDEGADPEVWAGVVPLVTRTLAPVIAAGSPRRPSAAVTALRDAVDRRRPPFA